MKVHEKRRLYHNFLVGKKCWPIGKFIWIRSEKQKAIAVTRAIHFKIFTISWTLEAMKEIGINLTEAGTSAHNM